MKLGVLTFHDGINHGAFFQAYSTYSLLKSLGYDVEIINYKNKRHWFNDYKAFLWTKRPSVLYKNIKKILSFKLSHKKFDLSSSRICFKKEKLNTLKYDAIIIGADIVWNYEWEFLGRDSIYFGEGLQSNKIISYAPSCGSINLDKPIPAFVKEGLKRFSHISVRDENTANLVSKAIGVNPQIVLDPTFIYDIRGEEAPIKECEPYLLVYAYVLTEKQISSTIKYANENSLKLISIGYSNSWCDKNIFNVGPFEWLSYFKNAEYILTGTFHGTIFSIKYEKKFITCNNPNIESKTKTILENIDLSHRVIDDESVEQLFNEEINYVEVNEKLRLLIDDSQGYLLGALNDEKHIETNSSISVDSCL